MTYTPAQRAAALALYTKGAPIKAIGASHHAIRCWRLAKGIQPRGFKCLEHPRIEEAMRLYRSGMNLDHIAWHLRIGKRTITKYARKAGLRRRAERAAV